MANGGPTPSESSRRRRVTVGLLTWNAGGDGIACARSLLEQTEPGIEIVWIDNASEDGTVERLRREFPGLPDPRVNPRNLGFCAGHNQGLAACRAPYYLALNQDVILEPDYLERICDWMDAEPLLALASGLILRTPPGDVERSIESATVFSAGQVFPRVRFPFELGMGGPVTSRWRRRRFVPGVTGSAMLLRIEACREASLDPSEIFPDDFFAYGEEVDLALRLARAGWRCGVEGAAVAWHRGGGSGGLSRRAIRAKYLANHWMLTLRHEPWSMILRELPYLLRGEFQYWLPRYLRTPLATLRAKLDLLGRFAAARRFYRQFEDRFGSTRERLKAYKTASLDELRRARRELLAESTGANQPPS